MAERILLVEDEEKLARMVELELNTRGTRWRRPSTGAPGWTGPVGEFDLVLLDIMLPALSGMEVLRRLRRESAMPVIMLTARDTVVDKVSGLDMGRTTTLPSPLPSRSCWPASGRPCASAPPRPRSRPEPAHRRSPHHGHRPARGEREWRGVELTRREFDLLRYLLENKERVISRESLLDHVWGFDFVGRPTQWTYTSAFCGPKSTSTSVSSSSTPSAAWAM